MGPSDRNVHNVSVAHTGIARGAPTPKGAPRYHLTNIPRPIGGECAASPRSTTVFKEKPLPSSKAIFVIYNQIQRPLSLCTTLSNHNPSVFNADNVFMVRGSHLLGKIRRRLDSEQSKTDKHEEEHRHSHCFPLPVLHLLHWILDQLR